jgi:hypothetical protein
MGINQQVYSCDTHKLLPKWMLYRIHYKNEGKSESCYAETLGGALKTKELLSFQGAKNIKIMKEGDKEK